MIGRIDVHAHLLPGVDDGCRDVEESIACAKMMVAAGYTHMFCTPHVWKTFDNYNPTIAPRVTRLQAELDRAGVALKLLPGGEMHISGDFCALKPEDLVTYNNAGKFTIFDFWAAELPPYFAGCIKHLRDAGIQPILAHPERIDAFLQRPNVIDEYLEAGLLIQCNLEPLGDETMSPRRTLAERWLREDRYFLLGSDLHRINTLEHRLRGLERATALVGEEKVWDLTHTNALKLMDG